MTSNGSGVAAKNRAVLTMPNAESAPYDECKNRLNRARWWTALAGLLAGLVSFGLGEAVYELFPAEKVEIDIMGRKVLGPTAKTKSVAELRNGALTFGLLGACLGGFSGMAGGLARRSAPAMSVAGLLGSTLGLATGAGVSCVVLPFFLYTQPRYPEYDLILSMIMHGSIWGLTGAVAGSAFAIGLGERGLCSRTLVAGFVGAVLGAVVFDLIGGAIFPFASTDQPISTTWPPRLMARLLVAVAIVTVVHLFLPRPPAAKDQQREVPAPAKS